MGNMRKLLTFLAVAGYALSVQPSPTGEEIWEGRYPEEGDLFEGDISGPLPEMTRAGIISPTKRWPSSTVVYQFPSNFPNDYRNMFQSAINHIVGRTCIRFRERQFSTEVNYILLNQANGCSSAVGRTGGQQGMSLSDGCLSLGTFVHELIHAIGFFHEQSRTDRDSYVTINMGNVTPGKEGNFDKYDASFIAHFGVSYDYSSIMHYGSLSFSRNGLPTITPKQSGAVIGQRKEMSKSDIWKVNNMYCQGTQGVVFQSEADGNYLDVVQGNPVDGQSIVTWEWLNQDNQRWTVDWPALLDPSRGSAVWCWTQNGGLAKGMDEEQPTAAVITWGYHGGVNQRWVAQHLSGSAYLVKNKLSGRCLYNNGGQRARCVPCNSADIRQRWLIYTAL